jgi:diamine N-acetyltransferase
LLLKTTKFSTGTQTLESVSVFYKGRKMEEACNQIHFERIRADSVLDICGLSESLPGEQRDAVADNALSIAQAHFSENAWIRAIYLGDTPIGFIMLHIGSGWEDGIDCSGVFLWRFMIARDYQGKLRPIGNDSLD